VSDHERLMAFAAAVEMAYQDERATCEGNAFSVNSRKFIAVWLHARGWVAATPAPLDVEHADCGGMCDCFRRGVQDEWEQTRD